MFAVCFPDARRRNYFCFATNFAKVAMWWKKEHRNVATAHDVLLIIVL